MKTIWISRPIVHKVNRTVDGKDFEIIGHDSEDVPLCMVHDDESLKFLVALLEKNGFICWVIESDPVDLHCGG